MKRIISFLLVVFFLIYSPLTIVYASEASTDSSTDTSLGGYLKFLGEKSESKFKGYLLSLLGYTADFASDSIVLGYEFFGYDTWEDYVKSNYNEETDSVEVSKEFVANFNLQVQQYIKDNLGYEIIEANNTGSAANSSWCVNHLNYFTILDSAVSKPVISSLIDDNDVFIAVTYGSQYAGCLLVDDMSDMYFVKNNESDDYCYLLYDSDLNKCPYTLDFTGNNCSVNVLNSSTGTGIKRSWVDIGGTMTSSGSTYKLIYRFQNDYKVFTNTAYLNDYLNGEKLLYSMSDVSSRIDDLTFTVNALNYDFEKYNSEAVEAIKKAIEDKKLDVNVDTLTEKQLQEVIDSVLSQKLSDIKDAVNSSGDTNSFQNTLIYQKLCQIYDLLNKWYNCDEVAEIVNNVDFTSLEKYLDGIFIIDGQNAFQAVIDELKSINTSIVKFETATGGNADIDLSNTFNNEFDLDVMGQLQTSVDKMKETFPLCIPWDLQYCLESLAYAPVAPCFEIPVSAPGIEGNVLVIDFSIFQPVSDISRTLLVILFCFNLYGLTLKIWEVL